MSKECGKNPLTKQEVNQLAEYNSEVARGIVHTEVWDVKMDQLQERFRKQEPIVDAAARVEPTTKWTVERDESVVENYSRLRCADGVIGTMPTWQANAIAKIHNASCAPTTEDLEGATRRHRANHARRQV